MIRDVIIISVSIVRKKNYSYALTAGVYKDDNEFVNWCFDIRLKHRALEMSERFNKQQKANSKDAEGHS